MNDNELRSFKYNHYGISEADRYILNDMLNLLQPYDNFNLERECFEAKMYPYETENVKKWYWHINNPPVNDIYRLLGHLQDKYKTEYELAAQSYLKSKSSS